MNRPSPKSIFLEALDQETPEQRATYLRSVCGDDVELRASVESLLTAHDQPANPLDVAPLDDRLAVTEVVESLAHSAHIGTTIGPYRLMEQIGEGGFGLVFVAQQKEPVKRKVALKIIKPGSGSREVLARFDAERQAVAMMDHPNIARIFDAGVTDDSRPYFVMELVRGQPITDFCDQHSLSVRERLDLFRDVCAATHHAHQKGVVHRDLKPSNVMVSLHDDKPVVKVIDFGVAKAMGTSLTDESIYTQFYSMIGTPLYMSPEQAAMSGLDVDTRSDIYSLGVLLYELLTGTTPFDRERLHSAGYDELRRIIREEEPPKPSTRLTTVQSQQSATLDNSHSAPAIAPAKRRESIQSDLDWIAMKALEKDRTRRYESAAAMSADVKRFLIEEPIEARPPSRGYQLRKFARRNRVALLTGALVASALIVGTVASLYQASRATLAMRDAVAARQEVEGFAERMKTANILIGNARAHEDLKQFAAADAAYTDAVELMPNYYLVWVQRAMLRSRLNLWEEAAEDFSEALRREAPIDSRQWEGAAALFFLTDRNDDYQAMYSRFMTPTGSDSAPLEFNAIRSCLIAPTGPDDAERMAIDIESSLAVRDGPGDFGPGNFGPGGFGPGNFGPDRPGPGPGSRPGREFGRGGPPRGPGGPRRGPGGPSFQNQAPRSVLHYVAGWANLRAENYEKALSYLDMAGQSRGPSGDMVHSLRAISLQRLGHREQAAEVMQSANDAMDDAIEKEMLTQDDRRPWIDIIEMILLHREATRELTGTTPQVDHRILEAQSESRELLGL